MSVQAAEAAASPPPRRVTLRRLMVLVAVSAACFAWVRPSLAPVAMVPIIYATFWPGGATWLAVETACAVGWLIGALEAFSNQAVDIRDLALFSLSGSVIGGSWFSRAMLAGISVKQGGRNPWRGWLWTPLVGFIGVALLATDRDFALRFAISEPAFRAEARRALSAGSSPIDQPGKRLGLIWVEHITTDGSGTVLFNTGGFIDSQGMAYVTGAKPPALGSLQFRPHRVPWWAFTDPF